MTTNVQVLRMCVNIYEWALQNFTASRQMLVQSFMNALEKDASVVYETSSVKILLFQSRQHALQFVSGFGMTRNFNFRV